MLEIINVLRPPSVHLSLIGVLSYFLSGFVSSWIGILLIMVIVVLSYLVGLGVGLQISEKNQ